MVPKILLNIDVRHEQELLPDADLRLFVGIALPDEVRQTLIDLTEAARSMLPDLRWLPAENCHLTLRFLGGVAESQRAGLQEELTRLASQHPSMTLQLGGWVVFPNLHRPQVVCLKVHEETTTLLASLAHSLTLWPPQPEKRPFCAHITVARNRLEYPISRHLIDNLPTCPVSWQTEAIHLFQSVPQPGGVCYRTLYAAKLCAVISCPGTDIPSLPRPPTDRTTP